VSFKKKTPFCVDLDGTLILNDVTWVGVKKYIKKASLKKKIMRLGQMFGWLLNGGRALLKQEIAKRVCLELNDIIFNQIVIDYVINEKRQGRLVYLATAADQAYAQFIMTLFPFFDGFFASDGVVNLRAQHKAKKLCSYFGGKKTFSYAGNSKDDLKVWALCDEKIAINPTKKIKKKLSTIGDYIEL
jgi:hypothetical protein